MVRDAMWAGASLGALVLAILGAVVSIAFAFMAIPLSLICGGRALRRLGQLKNRARA